MGRPRKEGMDYFPHDVDASQDEKIEAMRTMFGNDGYAFYFITLERIYRSEKGELDVSNRLFTLTLANKVMVEHDKLEQMIHASIEFGLFDNDVYFERRALTSNGIKKRSVQINALRDKWRNKKDDNKDSFLDGKLEFSQGKTHVFPEEKCIKESKVKESKVKEIEKENTDTPIAYAEFVKMTKSEYESLVERFGEQYTSSCIFELDNYKGATGKKYKSDYRAILNWVVERVKERESKPAPKAPSFQKNEKPKMQVAYEPDQQMSDDELAELFEMASRLDKKE